MKVFGVVGWKNAGKTGLMERLVHEITARGYSVSTIKHAHHRFDVDQPGKDSFRHRAAGAREVLLSSRTRWALMHETARDDEPDLQDLLAKIAPVDLVLVEGFKLDQHPKIEVHRQVNNTRLIAFEDNSVLALASDVDVPGLDVPRFDLNDTETIADFVLQKVGLLDGDPVLYPVPDLLPKPLRDDCFALPAGVDWVPVDRALGLLRDRLAPVVGQEVLAIPDTLGRVLALDILALRSNPPGANSAVDGYGLAHGDTGNGAQVMALAAGRAAAGSPFAGELPAGHAVRILTGALLPQGVDTIVMQEDITLRDGHIAFQGPLKYGANARNAGEDILAGEVALTKGHIMRAPDLALASATGSEKVQIFQRLKVGILSTGDEIVPPGSDMSVAKTFDANRPMLLGLARAWGYEAVDLGHVGDDRDELQARLDRGAETADVILTSGGASAGDEDHLSALLDAKGTLFSWRIALKPGRPLALANWGETPVFGLPGNPVAALVCALIFARPALSVLGGGAWISPLEFQVPAAFDKRKKAGRREYLRARLNGAGMAEVYPSEGSGRIAGLSWADGLVELGDDARDIQKGDFVRYLPYAGFGL